MPYLDNVSKSIDWLSDTHMFLSFIYRMQTRSQFEACNKFFGDVSKILSVYQVGKK